MNNYVIYHCHTPLSNIIANMDCVTPQNLYIQRAKELGMTALGFSEHGSVFDWVHKKDDIEAAGMKYIHAIEVYLTERILPEDKTYIDENGDERIDPSKIRDNYHCVLIAKNYDGVKEINKLSSHAFRRKDDGHFYYDPRITFDELFATSDNVIVTTACIAGALGIKATPSAKEKMLGFLSENRHRCFIEVQHHVAQKQADYNRFLLAISKEINVPLIAGTDTHSLNEDYAKARLIVEHGAGNGGYPDEDEFNLTMLSYDELVDEYRRQGALPEEEFLRAIDNTNVMAAMVEEFTLDKSYKYPKIYENGEEVLWQKIVDGYRTHPYAKDRYTEDEIMPRLREEYCVMCETGASDYMLLQMHIREWERKNGILYGPGRGSVGGSEVAYVTQITNCDAIKYNLPFSRFMSKERVSLADIDTDYDDESKARLTKYLCEDHLEIDGIRAAQICTFGTMKTRKAIEYVGKGLGYSLEDIDEMKKQLVDDEVPDSLRLKHKELFHYVDLVNGCVINLGIHASGVLISDRDIEAELGTATMSSTDYYVTQVPMKSLDALNYVKLDLLGLQNLKLFALAAKYSGLPRPTPDNPEFGQMDDMAVYNDLTEDTTMIFQLESDMAQAFVNRLFSKQTLGKIVRRLGDKANLFNLLVITNAALRPSGTSYRNDIAEGEFVDYELPQFTEFLDPTFGRLVFQESITGWLQLFCGYTGGEADVVRRIVAKKKPEQLEKTMPEIRRRFIETMGEKYGVAKEKAEEIIEPFLVTIDDASSYAFNQGHSTMYSAMSYMSAWYRHYHLLEWATAGLNTFDGDIEKTANITTYAQRHGVKILPIKFRESRNGYSFDRNTNAIYKGLQSVKSIGKNTGDSLYKLRDGVYPTFTDLLIAIKENCRGEVNSEHIEILIKLGFFEEFGEINALLHTANAFKTIYQNDVKQYKNFKVDTAKKKGIPAVLLDKFAERKTEKTYMGVDTFALLRQLESNYKNVVPARSIRDMIKDQMDFLGYISVVDKAKYKNVVYVLSAVTVYSPRLSVYCLANGKILDIKIRKDRYKKSPLKVDDFAMMLKYEMRPAAKFVDGKWVKDYTRKELWVENYRILGNEELEGLADGDSAYL